MTFPVKKPVTQRCFLRMLFRKIERSLPTKGVMRSTNSEVDLNATGSESPGKNFARTRRCKTTGDPSRLIPNILKKDTSNFVYCLRYSPILNRIP